MKILLLGFFSLLISTLCFADVPCGYSGKHDEGIEFYKSCGQIKGDQILLTAPHMENIVFEENGLACIMVGGGTVFYINQQGQSRRVVFNDNGCDYFEEGLARGYENGKMIYMDKNLNVVLRPDFEWLSPFDYDHAIVCNGPFETIQDGEHSLMKNGKCGLIDKKANLVVDAKYPIGDYDAFNNYINSHNHCPKPPITSKKSAICHAKRHLQHQNDLNQLEKIVSAKKVKDAWLVNFTYQDSPNDIFVIELESKTARWLSIVPVEE
jgi:hypothetical protein